MFSPRLHFLKARRSRTILNLFLLLLLSFSLNNLSFAQVLYGSLTGTVTDPSGSVVPGAQVTISNTSTGFSRTGTTDNTGSFKFSDLQPGRYQLNVKSANFSEYSLTDLSIAANSSQRVDVSLTVGGVTQQITVNDTPPALQTERADVNYDITSSQLSQLPTSSSSGRNFQSLYKLAPGIPPPVEQNSSAANPGRSQAINVNGVSNTINNTKIDGAAVGYPWLPALIAYMPSQDAIESVNLVTNSFTAEQGTAGGAAVNIIIKSGTNHFHGSGWEYNSISQFNARNYFYTKAQNPTLPKNIYNEFGGSLGGPIIKDKLFFFVDFNRFSNRKVISGLQSVPLSAVRGGDFSSAPTVIYDPATGNANGSGRSQFPGNIIPSSRLSPAAVKLMSMIPTERNSGQTNNYPGGGVLRYDRNTFDAKINYNATDKTTYFGRYSIQPSNIYDPPSLGAVTGPTWDGGQPGAALGRIQNVGLGFTHLFTSNVMMDANFGYGRIRINGQAPDYGSNFGLDTLGIPGTNGTSKFQSGIPIFNFSNGGLSSLGNTLASNPFKFRDQQYVGNVNLSWIRVKHSLRFGGEYVHSAINQAQTNGNSPRGLFAFNGGATGNNDGVNTPSYYRVIADFLLGLPQSFGKSTQLFNPNGPRFSTFAFYAQDQWKATSNLTISYGIRYEYYPFATRDHTGVFRYDPTTGLVLIGGRGSTPNDTGVDVHWGMIVPRLGVNYRINDKTVVRSGFGMTVDPDNFRSLRDTYPAIITQTYTGTTYVPAGALNTGYNNTLPSGTFTAGIPAATLPDISSGVLPLPAAVSTNTVPKDFRRGYIESWNLFLERNLAKDIVATVGYVGTNHIRQIVGLDINAAPFGSTSSSARPLKTSSGATITTSELQMTPFGGEKYAALQLQLTDRQWRSLQFGYAYTWSHALNFFDENSTLGSMTYNSPALLQRNYATSSFDRTHNNALWTIYELPFGKGRQFMNKGLIGAIFGGIDMTTVLQYASGSPFQLSDTTYSTFGDTQTPNQLAKPLRRARYKTINGVSQLIYIDRANYTTGGQSTPGNVGRNSVRGPGLFNLDVALSKTVPIWREYKLTFRAESFDITNTPQFANPNSANYASSAFGVITTSNASRSIRLSGRFTF